MLVTALRNETTTVARLTRRPALAAAGTRHTAWSQHCLCGPREKKDLSLRMHQCTARGLHGDKDLVSALVGAHTIFGDPTDPGTARIDWAPQLTPSTRSVSG
jgi:hypothetical protein